MSDCMARGTPLFPRLLALAALAGCGSMGLSDALSDGTYGMAELEPAGELNFGSVSPYGRPVSLTVEIVSTGIDPVTVTDVWIETDQASTIYVGAVPFPMTIEPGDVVPFEVRFMPSTSGNFHGRLVVGLYDGTTIERNVVGVGCPDNDRDGTCQGE